MRRLFISAIFFLISVRVFAQAGCETIRCAPGYECDPFGPPFCVPVSCEAESACKEGYKCVPQKIFCVRAPCPQFRCERVSKGCETTCGELIKPFSFYHDDGENYCKSCFCLGYGYKFCNPKTCEEDPTQVCGDPTDKHCTTACGRRVEIGENFQDDGENHCNVCSCTDEGTKICTLIFCDQNPENNFCGCVSECGKKVESGVSFTDDGHNNCNDCLCGETEKACTKRACEPQKCFNEDPNKFCSTTCGKKVGVGLTFQDDGPNMCNSCVCQSDGTASCTEMGCDGISTCD